MGAVVLCMVRLCVSKQHVRLLLLHNCIVTNFCQGVSSSSGTKPRFKNAVSGAVLAMYEMNTSSPAASGLG